MARIAWENRDQLPFAWRILDQGVCDGCALGTSGLRDWTMDGMHLCMVRLELMRLNTAPALDPDRLANVAALDALCSRELRELGRLPEPMIRRRGEQGFRVVSWDEAYAPAAEKIRATQPERFAVYLTSRGILNEHYYAAQKAARVLGTNHVDNSARLCHAASTAAMKRHARLRRHDLLLSRLDRADLIVFFGSNTPNNQPVTMKYLYHARQAGHEGGRRQSVLSSPASKLLDPVGSRVRASSARACRRLVRRRHRRRPRVPDRRVQGPGGRGMGGRRVHRAGERPGSRRRARSVAASGLGALERESGTTRAEMRRFARLLRAARGRRSSSGRWG